MKCKKVEDLLDMYIEGRLGSSTAQQVKEHIDSCPSCSSVYSKWQEILSVMKNGREVPLPDNFNEQLHQKLLSLEQLKNRQYISIKGFSGWLRKTFWIPQPALAGIAIMLLVVSLPVYFYVHQYNIRKASYLEQAQLCSAPANHTVVLNFSINAKESLKDVTLTVNLPEELQLIDTGDFTGTGNKAVWKGDLLKGNNSIYIKVKSYRGGDWQIKALLEKEGRSKVLERTLRTI